MVPLTSAHPSHISGEGSALEVSSRTLAGNIKYSPHTQVVFTNKNCKVHSNLGPIFKLGEGGTLKA